MALVMQYIALNKKLMPSSNLLVKISKQLNIFCVRDRKNVFQFKMSTRMVSHIGKGQQC